MIKEAIKKVIEGNSLSEQEMITVMNQIMDGQATNAQIASFITALRMKGETVDEITGAAKTMRERAVSIPVRSKGDLVDIVGTGGDMANTFNISTAAAFVACGAGLRIAKHGNRSASSSCGSADVIEKLGINIDISPQSVGRCIDEIDIGFLFARKLHLAMKHAASARKDIGIGTIFNILGPLTNPADADILVIGVFDERLTQLLAKVLKNLRRKRALVVHGKDGLDEITLSSETMVSELKNGTVETYLINPEDFGLPIIDLNDIRGGTQDDNAEIILNILKGEKGPHRDIVCINAGAAIMASEKAGSLQEAIALAYDAIDSGSALQKLSDLRELTRGLT